MGRKGKSNGRAASKGDEISKLTLHANCNFEVDVEFACPLRGSRFDSMELSNVELSARKGCPECILRYVAVKQNINPLFDWVCHTVGVSHDQILEPIRVNFGVVLLVCSNDGALPSYSFYGQPSIDKEHRLERKIPFDTSSTESLRTVRRWISECDEGHDCMKEVVSRLPRRLLDVRNSRVRLYETIGHDKAKYACLSHCWGSLALDKTLRTTMDTLSFFMHDIPWHFLPQTFQDAVSFVRKLNIYFLWIDCLCIIQDSPLDWQQQSGDMASIYQNAYITLAATASLDASGGCYTSNRLKQDLVPLAVLRYPNGSEREIYARIALTHGGFPLLTRGWIYQERLLSPRVLHFAGKELIWECDRKVDCECGSQDVGKSFKRPKNDPTFSWNKVIEDYTALSLTFPNDILPALSGIAKVFATRLQDQYVAGMWRRTIIRDLLWYHTGESKAVMKPWRAPSWSWASASHISKPNSTRFRHLPVSKELARVTEIFCVAVGADETGELASANLTIETKAIAARLKRSPSSETASAEYAIIVGDVSILSPRANYDWSLHTIETAYLNLNDSCLSDSIDSVDVIIAQIAACDGPTSISLQDVYANIDYVQHIRFCLLLARAADDDTRWVRIGLVTIAEYEPDMSLYGPQVKDMHLSDIAAALRKMTKKEIKIKLEERAKRNRGIFYLLNKSKKQKFVVW
jgi:hypothetical protein